MDPISKSIMKIKKKLMSYKMKVANFRIKIFLVFTRKMIRKNLLQHNKIKLTVKKEQRNILGMTHLNLIYTHKKIEPLLNFYKIKLKN
jgi:hypothetical protein